MVRLLVLVLFGWVSLVTVVPTEAGTRTSAGDLLWQVDFDLADGDDRATAVAAAHGRVVVVGFATNPAGDTDWIVRAHEARTGRILWRDRVAVAGRHEEALAVAMDEHRVVVAGVSVDDTGRSRALVRAYVARTGALAWRDAWTGAGVSLAMHEGTAVVASIVTNATGAGRILVRRYASKNGVVAWEDRSAPTGFTAGSIAPRALVIQGHEVYLATTVAPAGSPVPGPDLPCLVRAYDLRTGRVRWNAIHTASSIPGASGVCIPLAIASDGRRVVIAGVGDVSVDQFVVASFDARTGAFLWEDMTVLVAFRNVAMAVAIERGHALVAGWRHIPGNSIRQAFVVRSYEASTGVLSWEDLHFSDGPFTFWHGLDLEARRGRVYAVGQDENDGTWLVRAYEAAHGDVLWEDLWEPPGARGADPDTTAPRHSVAVSGGRVFVAGPAFNADGNMDLVLRAYDAR